MRFRHPICNIRNEQNTPCSARRAVLRTHGVRRPRTGSRQPTDANVFGHVVDRRTQEHVAFATVVVVGTTFGDEAWKDIYRLVNKVKTEKYLF